MKQGRTVDTKVEYIRRVGIVSEFNDCLKKVTSDLGANVDISLEYDQANDRIGVRVVTKEVTDERSRPE